MPFLKLGRIAACTSLAVLASCAATVPVASPPATKAVPSSLDRITYELGGCRGFCPAYSFSIAADGNAHFEGIQNTAVAGAVPVDATPFAFRDVVQALAPARPDGERVVTATNCENYSTDQQEVTVSWERSGKVVDRLVFDLGCRDPSQATVRAALKSARAHFPVDDKIGRATEF